MEWLISDEVVTVVELCEYYVQERSTCLRGLNVRPNRHTLPQRQWKDNGRLLRGGRGMEEEYKKYEFEKDDEWKKKGRLMNGKS